MAYVGIERVQQIVRFDYRQGRLARARPPDRGAARHEDCCRTTRASNAWRWRRKDSPLAGTLISISERGLDTARQSDGLPDRRRGRRVLAQAHRRFRRQRLRGDAGRQAAGAGAPLLMDARLGDAHPQRAARGDQARRAGRWAGADLRRHGLADRQHGRPVGAPRRLRRAGADADLRRQFLAAAADPAAAVHAESGNETRAIERVP